MESRMSCLVLVCLMQLCILGGCWGAVASGESEHRHRHEHLANDIPERTAAEMEHKLMLECQHSDYRTYIKCLKREKRQHAGLGNSRACLDECFFQNLQNCTTSSCLRDCHTHCRKRLIETYSQTWETSFDCKDGNCSDSARLPNITNNILIENIMPTLNCTNGTKGKDGDKGRDGEGGESGESGEDGEKKGEGKKGKDGERGKDGGRGGDGTDISHSNVTYGVPKIDINNVINNRFESADRSGYPSPSCPCPGCYCYPWQQMPQITIGIGGGPVGGCMFPSSWPCFQRFPAPSIDCSMCSNPFLRLQCNPGCVQDSQRNNTSPTTQRPATSNTSSYSRRF